MPETTLEERIAKERRRRARSQPWHYWQRSGRTEAPYEEFFCVYCGGYFGVPHSHHGNEGFCRSMGQTGQCACIDCWVWDGRKERVAPGVSP